MEIIDTARLVLGAITAFMLVVAALSKVTGQQSMHDMADHFAIPWPRYRAIGWLELAAVAGIALGFWWEWLGVAAGAGTVLLLIGAVVVHVRTGDRLHAMGPAVATLVGASGYLGAQVLATAS